MDGYKSLLAWQAASELCLRTLEATDKRSHPRMWAVVDQLRRAAISVDINIVEGYAVGSPAAFRRHLRIAIGSAAEVERLLEIAAERKYLSADTTKRMIMAADRTIRLIYWLLRSPRLPRRTDAT